MGTGTYFRLTGNVTKLLKRGFYGTARSLTFGGSTWASAGANTRFISGSAIIGDPQHDVLALDFQQNCSGTVTIDGTAHTVSKITKSSTSIAYQLTDGTFQYIHPFGGEGSAGSVYTGHVSSIAIEGQTEAILTSTILPNAVGKDIGSAAVKFLNLYLGGAVSANTGTFSGALSCASVNTGHGDFEIGQNLRTTDSPTFAGVGIANWMHAAGAYFIDGMVKSSNFTSNTKMVEARIKHSGTITVTMRMNTKPVDDRSNTSYARIYVNGVARGTQRVLGCGSSTSATATYTENIAVNDGDLVQVYGYNTKLTGLTVYVYLSSTRGGVLNGYGTTF